MTRKHFQMLAECIGRTFPYDATARLLIGNDMGQALQEVNPAFDFVRWCDAIEAAAQAAADAREIV